MEVYRQWIDVMQTANCKIKDLLIMTEFDALVLVDYLKGCSLLERLSFPELPTQPSSLVTSLAKVIQRNCSRLRHLDLISPQLSDSALSEVIVACNPSANQDNGSGLLSLNTRLCGTLVSATLDAIVGHRATLTSLSIRQGKGVTAPGLQRIVTSCVHLRWLNATVIFTDTIPIAMEEIERKPWLCRDLRTLSVCFTDHCTAVGRLPALHFLQNFYAQVGGLDSLEVLSFRMGQAGWVPMRQLFLEGLKQLFRLKTLRRFGFHKEEAAALQKQHIEAMLEQWPKLEQLAGTNYRGLKISEWLKQVRPNLDLDPLIKGL
ncbi:hypothetical protein BGZ49_009570 [Haplosporangium sp. Z 27]|nr:hypothetical protein BGZ49_009570 [Haplosporangium sp. Z 27]